MTNLAKSSNLKARGRPAVSDKQRANMQARISQVVKTLSQTEGFGQISMRKIAREIGCSPMTLYKYYNSKMDILRTLWADVFDELFTELNGLDQPEQSPTARLHILASGYVHYWLTHPEHYRLVFMADGVSQGDVSIFTNEAQTLQRFQVFSELIGEVNDGQLSAQDLKVKADTLICFLQGISHNLITISGYDWAEAEYMVTAAVDAVTR